MSDPLLHYPLSAVSWSPFSRTLIVDGIHSYELLASLEQTEISPSILEVFRESDAVGLRLRKDFFLEGIDVNPSVMKHRFR